MEVLNYPKKDYILGISLSSGNKYKFVFVYIKNGYTKECKEDSELNEFLDFYKKQKYIITYNISGISGDFLNSFSNMLIQHYKTKMLLS